MASRALKPFFVGKRVEGITPLLIQRYNREGKAQKRGDVTLNRKLAFLKDLFIRAITCGKATTNPVKQVRLFREDNARIRFLTEQKEARLIAHYNPQPKPLVMTAPHTGFRTSELLSLRSENIDFRNRLIKVDSAYSKTDDARCGLMTETLTAALKSLKMSAAGEPTAAAFGHWQMTKTSARAAKLGGLVDFIYQDLRPTFASRPVMAGVDLAMLKALMGHQHSTVTLRYIHLAPGHVRSALARLDPSGKKSQQISQRLLKSHLLICHKLLTNNHGGVGLLVWPLDFKSSAPG
jgi:integrase